MKDIFKVNLNKLTQFKKFEKKLLPEDIDYNDVKGLKNRSYSKIK